MEFKGARRLNPDVLRERGYVDTCQVGAGNTIWNKWGFELMVHGPFAQGEPFVYCEVHNHHDDVPEEHRRLKYEHELNGIEYRLNIDKTENIYSLSIEDLKNLIPISYEYITDKRKKDCRYLIVKDGINISGSWYNPYYKKIQPEIEFLREAALFILTKEKLQPRNKLIEVNGI